MTPEKIEELRRLHREATPGEWSSIETHAPKGWVLRSDEYDIAVTRNGNGDPQNTANSQLIPAIRNALPALLDAAERESKLRAFAQDIMECWPDGDVDGGHLQEMAEKHGLLRAEHRTEPCGGDSECSCFYMCGLGDFPMICYRRTALLEGRGDE